MNVGGETFAFAAVLSQYPRHDHGFTIPEPKRAMNGALDLRMRRLTPSAAACRRVGPGETPVLCSGRLGEPAGAVRDSLGGREKCHEFRNPYSKTVC